MAAEKTLMELVRSALTEKELTPGIRGILGRIDARTATWEDVHTFAAHVGRCNGKRLASYLVQLDEEEGREVLLEHLSRVVHNYLGRNHQLVSEASGRMMQSANQRAGIGLKVQRPGLDDERISGLVEEIRGKENLTEFSDVLVQQIENYSQSIVDSTIRANAQAHYGAGLRPKIVRRAEGKCCQWCDALAGVYDYADVRDTGNDVFRRHTNCNCVVEYQAGQRARNVWTKQEYRTDAEAKAERMRRAGLYDKLKK